MERDGNPRREGSTRRALLARTPFAAGIRRTIAWFDADPARQQIDAATNDRWDRLTAAYEEACRQAREQFGGGIPG